MMEIKNDLHITIASTTTSCASTYQRRKSCPNKRDHVKRPVNDAYKLSLQLKTADAIVVLLDSRRLSPIIHDEKYVCNAEIEADASSRHQSHL